MYRLVAFLLLIVFVAGCGTAPTEQASICPSPQPAPTCTPPPTYTPYPTYTPVTPPPTPTPAPMNTPAPSPTPQPTYPPVTQSSAIDLAHDAGFANAINAYREAHGKQPLFLSYHLAYIAASRVQLTMIVKNGQSLDLGQIPIDPRTMPDNYAWSEFSFWGDSSDALAVNSPQRALDYFINTWGEDNLLTDEYTELGTSLLCNGQRCGFIVILGHPHS